MKLDRLTAEVYARCFGSLSDPNRVLILNLLARVKRPLSVGEIVAEFDLGQSTVSHHLKTLATVGFVIAERRGTSTYYRVNERCFECFPSAAELVMGDVPRPRRRRRSMTVLPWLEEVA
ncbi:MAG: metalloregulator ArsR/SmtB family transcription factor [Chloroflexota bacterium]|nr:metalloregulator ArsR/SmtB family transcription factor [Chloroflexota bacterium]